MTATMIVTGSDGRVVELSSTGEIRRQIAAQDGSSWVDIDVADLPAKVKCVSVRFPSNDLVVLLANGQLYEMHLLFRDVASTVRWRQVAA